MKERPILFSGQMVRAALDGRKTQTRRVIKPAYGLGEWATAIYPAEESGWVAVIVFCSDEEAAMFRYLRLFCFRCRQWTWHDGGVCCDCGRG